MDPRLSNYPESGVSFCHRQGRQGEAGVYLLSTSCTPEITRGRVRRQKISCFTESRTTALEAVVVVAVVLSILTLIIPVDVANGREGPPDMSLMLHFILPS